MYMGYKYGMRRPAIVPAKAAASSMRGAAEDDIAVFTCSLFRSLGMSTQDKS